jgi:hypothetical protein
MAYTAGNLFSMASAPPGRGIYRYDTTDPVDTVEAANYFNNVTNNLKLAKGDRIDVFTWSATPFASASLVTNALQLVVTNVIADDAAAGAGRVNCAQVFLSTSLFSSLT